MQTRVQTAPHPTADLADQLRSFSTQVPEEGCSADAAQACAGSSNPQEVLTKEMERLMESLEPGTKKDIAKIKDKVFGPMVFWVTDTRPDLGRAPGSYLVRLPYARAAGRLHATHACGTSAARQHIPDPPLHGTARAASGSEAA